MPIVEFPNGDSIDFPEGTPESTISEISRKHWTTTSGNVPTPNFSVQQQPPIDPAMRGKSLTDLSTMLQPPQERGQVAGIEQGATDPALKLGQLGIRIRELMGFPTSVSSDQAQKQLQDREQSIEASRGADSGTMDWPRALGNFATTSPAAAVMPGGPFVNALLSGGVSGALQPVPEGDLLGETAKGAAIGAGSGLAGAGILGAAGRLISPAASSGPAAKLVKEGVTPTAGQLMGGAAATTEAKLTSIPVIGDVISSSQRKAVENLNVAAYNRALSPIGEKSGGKAGFQGIEEVHKKLTDAYTAVEPQLAKFHITPEFVNDFRGALAKAVADLPSPEVDTLTGRIMGSISKASDFKDLETRLTSWETRYSGPNATPDQRVLSEHIGELLATARDHLALQNPQVGDRLAAINKGWANYAILRKAAAQSHAREGVFSPEVLDNTVKQQAIRRGGAAGEAAVSEGRALMQDLSSSAVNILGRKYPDSGSIGRLLTSGTVLGGLGIGTQQGYIDPTTAAGLGLLMVPYAPGVRQTIAKSMTYRPALAGSLGRGLGTLAPIGAPAGAAIGESLLQ